MGVLGYSEFFTINFNNDFYLVDYCINCLYHGINWVYLYSNFIFFFNLKLIFLNILNFFFYDNFILFNYWFFYCFNSSYQLIFSVLCDQFFFDSIKKFFYIDEWFKNIFSIKDLSILLVSHQEFFFIKFQIIKNFYFNYFTNIFLSLYNYIEFEVMFLPILLFIQLTIIISIFILFINCYCSFFLTFLKEEHTIDADYFFNFLTIESEKEITCFDDIILVLTALTFIFGWYFLLNCWFILINLPELTIIFFLFPILYIIIIGIPTFLIYDFGIYYLVYLKGVGSSSLILFELMFDYIAIIIFYTRILVQGVRLILMIFIYFSMHELLLDFFFKNNLFLNYEIKSETLNNSFLNNSSISYYFLFIIPGKIFYWIYEVFHMFFVVTVQFIAFFAIVFWLFLFLYTFFVIEKQENFFFEKRIKRKNYFKNVYINK